MTIQEITPYQMAALSHAAQCGNPVLIVGVVPADANETVRSSVERARTEMEGLVPMGLLDNITSEYQSTIDECVQDSNGKLCKDDISIFGLTRDAFLMFGSSENRRAN